MNVLLQPLRPALVTDSREHLQVLVRMQAPADESTATAHRKPIALAVVVDRSGSMEGPKIREARRCTEKLLTRLADDDMASLTIYDTEIDTLLNTAPVSGLRPVLQGVVNRIRANGGTDLHGGWLQGAESLASLTSSGRMCRVMLLSDGQANSGLTATDAICEQVRALAKAGITTSTVGFGSDFNEVLMTSMAQAGQGNAWYGERAEDLESAFESELSLLQATAYTNVSLKIEASADEPRSTGWVCLNRYTALQPQQWLIPNVADGAEAWAVLELPMHDAIVAQALGSALRITVEAIDKQGEQRRFTASLPVLPVRSKTEWLATQTNELAQARLREVSSAAVQRRLQEALQNDDWATAESLLCELKTLAQGNAWLTSSFEALRQRIEDRDQIMAMKETVYKNARMSNRLAAINEDIGVMYDCDDSTPEFLRLKPIEGRMAD